MGRLEGRAAIVTGASRGIGRAIAIAMAAEGVSVVVVARTDQVWDDRLPGTIGETVAEIEAAGGARKISPVHPQTEVWWQRRDQASFQRSRGRDRSIIP